MTTEERLTFTQELFRTNAGCKLPCWWGITPGVTPWSEVDGFLRYMGESIGPPILEKDSSIYQGPADFDISSSNGIIVNRVGFLEREGVIELIDIYSEGYSNPLAFQEQWAMFSPQRVIAEYGIPSRVWLQSFAGGPVTEGRIAGYTLWVFYDNLGFAILYNGYGEYAPTFHFCPRFEDGKDIRFLEMYLQSPDNPNPIEKTAMIIGGMSIKPYPYIQTIEQAAGITPTEFYHLFTQESNQACFDTPRDIWPYK